MENRTFYYARVSSREQNLDRQIDAFKELGANERNVIVAKESVKNLERTGCTALKNNMLRSGDTWIDPPVGQEWVYEMVENILIEVLGSFAENERKQIEK